MAKLRAVMMHGARGGEGAYTFDVPEETAQDTPVRIMRAFMEYLDAHAHLGHIDYEINAAMKNRALGVTTVIGQLRMGPEHGDQPFACFISRVE